MGIPSYYKKLTRHIKGLVHRGRPCTPGWLLFDFNCLMYHVLRRPGMPAFRPDAPTAWENEFLEHIMRYTYKVIKQVGPTEGIYIAVDGVAPMAKIRQQRMRRFRGARDRRLAGEAEGAPAWDTNSLTPGTAFMDRLGARLRRLAVDHATLVPQWRISAADEPGEGEQKLVAFIRSLPNQPANPYIIYGLDADLIVLSLWTQAMVGTPPVWLFREDVEAGEIKRDSLGEELFVWFSIDTLRVGLGLQDSAVLQDYCAAMMILGNDFLPTSLSFRIKEDGHDRLVEFVRGLGSAERLWTLGGGLNAGTWCALFAVLGATERDQIQAVIRKKLGLPAGDDAEDEPLRLKAERVLCGRDGRTLKADWNQEYYIQAGCGDVGLICRRYLETMRWVVMYYTGLGPDGRAASASAEWYFPWSLPPLWSDLAIVLGIEGWGQLRSGDGEVPLRPVEQLGLVLPRESWGLIPAQDPVARLPVVAPEWFPENFGIFSIGKRWLWECEPEIPIPTPAMMRGRCSLR
jgi:5'-3' exonuclease